MYRTDKRGGPGPRHRAFYYSSGGENPSFRVPSGTRFLEATQLKTERTVAAVLRIEPAVAEAQVVGIGTRNRRRPAVPSTADGIQCTVLIRAEARGRSHPLGVLLAIRARKPGFVDPEKVGQTPVNQGVAKTNKPPLQP